MRTAEPVAKGFDMDVARAQLDRLFDEVIDRAHDRRAAGQVPQIVDVLVSAADLALPTAGRRLGVEIELVAQNGRDVFERSRYDFKRPPKTSSAACSASPSAGSPAASAILSVAGLEWEYRSLAQEPRRETIRQRAELRQFQKSHSAQAEKRRDFVGEFMRG